MMNKIKTGLFISVVCALSITCKKEHIQPEQTVTGSPVFYFNGLINSIPVSMSAGQNNYYMYSSYAQDSIGVYSYTGNLKQVSSVYTSLQITINDYRMLGTGAPETNISKSLDTGSYTYYITGGNPVNNYTITYTPTIDSGSASVQSYVFNFGDGDSVSGTILPTNFVHTYYGFANYKPHFSVLFSDSGKSLITVPQTIQPNDTGKNAVGSSLTIYAVKGNLVTFKVTANIPSGTGSLTWNFGDSGSGTNIQTQIYSTTSGPDTLDHTYINAKIYTATTTLKTGNDSVQAACSVRPNSTNPYKDIASFTASPPVITPNPKGLSAVTVTYTDPTGDVYTSADSAQRSGTNFQILSISPYQNNQNNQSTKQLHIQFNCWVFDNKGKSVHIMNGNAVIAVAYK